MADALILTAKSASKLKEVIGLYILDKVSNLQFK